MIQIVPEIYIRDCGGALEFYRDIFGGEIRNVRMSDDNALFQETHGKVIHSELHVNPKCIFYFADILNERRSHLGNVTIMLHMGSKSEIEEAYGALSEGGHVDMELQKTFSGAYHAILTDRFGAPWALNHAGRYAGAGYSRRS